VILSETAELLGKSFLFAGLDAAQLEALAALTHTRRLAAGEFVFREEDPADNFYVVRRGRIKVLKHASTGKDFIIAFFNPGEMFGEVAVFGGKPYPAAAQTAENSEILGIRGADFLKFISTHPDLSLRIINVLGGRLRDAQSRLKDLAAERAEPRLARILLMLGARIGEKLPFTRQEIADMAGVTVETAIRIISRFKEDGIISPERGGITIRDSAALRDISQGS
jgi:CRP-like cAMP-binding protein